MDLAILDWLAGGLAVGTGVGGVIKSIAMKGKVEEGEQVRSHQERLAQCGYCRRDAVGYHAGLKRYVCENHIPESEQEPARARQVAPRVAPQRARRPEPIYEDEEEWEDEGDEEEWWDEEEEKLYDDVEVCQHGFEVGRCKACYEVERRRRAIAAAQQTYVQTEPVPRLRQSQVARQLGNRRGPLPTQSRVATQRPVQRLPPMSRQRPVQQQLPPQRRRRQYVDEQW